MNTKLLIGTLMLAYFALLIGSVEAKHKSTSPNGERLFAQHCGSCHTSGGNRVKPSKPVAESKQLATLATFKGYLSAPPGHMPYYEHIVNDKEVLQALYQYCKKLKKHKTNEVATTAF